MNFGEFKVFKLKYLEDDEEKTAHDVFVKKYRSEKKSSDKPSGKTLVALNLPPYITKKDVHHVFSVVGDIDNITLFDSYDNIPTKYEIPSQFFSLKVPFKFLIGLIVYKKSSSVDLIFSLDSLPPMCTKASNHLTGMEKWTSQHNEKIVNNEELIQREIEDYMKHYDKVKEAEENQEQTADDDGWIQVGKKGHYSGFKQKESVVHRLEQKLELQRKKARKNLQQITGLYAHENQEIKKQELIEMKKKFEEDKSRLLAMKQNRKFKPY